MYRKGNPQYDYHEKTFGPANEFGYKDLIPLFTAEKFNADEWAEIFKASGARFAGPVAEHHDGFSMWDSKVNPWNASKMGPGRDVVGELEKAIRGAGMRFMTTFHQFWRAKINEVIDAYQPDQFHRKQKIFCSPWGNG